MVVDLAVTNLHSCFTLRVLWECFLFYSSPGPLMINGISKSVQTSRLFKCTPMEVFFILPYNTLMSLINFACYEAEL